ncbi:MAG TPA: hypothetical protein VN706_05975 [Gemmatimonadaceae bacterium]|nr:hypothetical protein [Gemmatimonadaceae bacterium]
MKSFHKLVVAGGAVAMLAGCMHRGVESVSGGDVAVDSLSATRTAIVRVDNSSGQEVRVYMLMPHMKPNYIAKSMSGQVRSWVLDPNQFPAQDVSFEVQDANHNIIRTLGPFNVHKNQTVDIVVSPNGERARASIHPSVP